MKMFATFDSHVQLDSNKIHVCTPYLAGGFSDFLSTCDHAVWPSLYVCANRRLLNPPPSVSRHLNLSTVVPTLMNWRALKVFSKSRQLSARHRWPCTCTWAASVAQLAEHWTSNPVVTGSNPVRGSSVFFHCLPLDFALLPLF